MLIQSRYILLVSTALCLIFLQSCRKDDLITDNGAKLRFSTDSILFDTVFVTIGSVTKNIRVYNDHDQAIRISSIRLAGGNSSRFRMNVNGLPGRDFTNTEIRANDSLWIFVEVTVDPNSQLTPYVILDSIVFETNGNIQDVNLAAWGQNANFFVAQKRNPNLPPYVILDTNLNSTTTWNDQLPYVIYGGFLVVDSSTTLRITEGTKIHFSNNAGLWVYKGGTLEVTGTKDKPVIFQGLRREETFAEEPGQWDRIWINDGGLNSIDHAIIKNAFIGIQTETISEPLMTESLKLTNTYIRNCSGYGMLAFNFKITGWNNIIANCGLFNLYLTYGGDYEFTNCTFANFWDFGQRGTPAVFLNDHTDDQNVPFTKAEFNNCIISGNIDNELVLDMADATSVYNFRYTLIKADNNTPTSDIAHFENVYRNAAPGFHDPSAQDYHIDSLAFPVDKGNDIYVDDIPGFTLDLDNNPRKQGAAVDLGAYERP